MPILPLLKQGKSLMLRAGLLAMIFSFCYFSGTSQTTVSNAQAKKWERKGDWRKGLSMKPDGSIDAVMFYTQFHQHPDWWQKAIDFMKRKDLATLAPGTYPIVGKDVYAMIQAYVPKDLEKSLWEAHRNYADIQAVITGEEKIGKSDPAKLKEVHPYNASGDAANYEGPGDYYVAKPGTFFIFFPGQAHRPGLKVHSGDTATVTKLVIKMRVD